VKFHRYIVGCLWAGALLLVVLLVSLTLWVGLHALGDPAGGHVFAAIAVVTAACWGLNFVALVVLLALAQLSAGSLGPLETDFERDLERDDE
jgi:hypothetical protein